MAAFKYTALFQQSTIHPTNNAIIRVGGWSESWYDTPGTEMPAFLSLCERRAALLANNAAIVGQRVQRVDPAGAAQVFSQVFPGTAGVQPDIPQMALLCRARAVAVTNTRQVILRGIPDTYVENGEYSPSGAYAAKLLAFIANLVSNSWKFRGRNLAANQQALLNLAVRPTIVPLTISVNADGALGGWIAVGTTLKISGALDVNGIRRTGLVKVTAIDGSAGNFDAINWPYGACSGGKVQEISYIFPVVADVQPNRIITRRVGRPFTSYRGRASKKRRRQTVPLAV